MTDPERAATEAAEKAFREFVVSKAYPAWAALERVRCGFAEPDGHVRAWINRKGSNQ